MPFEQQMLEHLCLLIDFDRAYAEQAIQWYFKTCPWLKDSIGPQLRAKWRQTNEDADRP